MRVSVFRQIGRSTETFEADVTLEQFIPSVSDLVPLKIGGCGKSFFANKTFVWLDAAVENLVSFKVAGPFESLAANITFKRSLPGVYSVVKL